MGAHFIFSLAGLTSYLKKNGYNIDEIDLPSESDMNAFRLMIPTYYVDLINWKDQDDPLRKMVLTDAKEKDVKSFELEDPIGDTTFSPVPGLVHRHPDRCLLLVTGSCLVHCRFCFRRTMLESSHFSKSKAIAYLKEHPEIREVILTGGDPLALTPERLRATVASLNEIPHIKVIRIHTRTPAVYPNAVTIDLLNATQTSKRLVYVVHVNHAREITPQFENAMRILSRSALLLSQSVLMKGVNDTVETLCDLFNKLTDTGVKPYYLHHPDLVKGTNHFRLSIEDGKKLYTDMRQRLAGHSIPEYVLDLPGGGGKVLVTTMRTSDNKHYKTHDFMGRPVTYKDPSCS